MPQFSFLPQQRHARQWLLVGIAMCIFAGVVVYDIAHEHTQANESAEHRLHVQLRIIDENLNAQLQAANQALKGVIRDIPEWKREGNPRSSARRLVALSEAIPGVHTVMIADAEGKVLQSNRSALLGMNFSHLEYFATAKADRDPGKLYVSPPFVGYTGAYIINLTRVIPGPNGEFNGVVVASLNIRYFNTLLSSVLHAPDMWAAIVHGDGRLFLTVPQRDGMIGGNLSAEGSILAMHRDSGRQESIVIGSLKENSAPLLLGIRTIQPPELRMDKSLVVMLSRDPDAILASWRETSILLGTISLGVCLLIGGGLHYYQRIQRRNEAEALAADRALKQSTERLRLATRAAMLGIWEFDLKRHHLSWDESMFEIYGIPPTAFEPMYKSWANAVLPEDLPAVEQQLWAAVDGKLPFSARFRIRRGDGEIRTIRALADVFYDETGDPLKMVGLNEDITARQQAGAALREAEERFRSAFDNAAIGMALVSPEGRFLEANHALAKLLGYSEEELGKLSFQEITHPDDLDADLALLRELSRNLRISYRMEKRYLRKSGDIVWAELAVSALRDDQGQVRYFIAQVQDISARKLADERVLQERDLFAGGPAMVFVWQATQTWPIEYASANATAYLGYTPEEITSPQFKFIEHIHPEDRPRVESAMKEFLYSGEAGLELSYRFRTKNEDYRWFYDYNVAERDADGKLLRMRCYMLDQSNIKATEEALRNTNLILSDVLGSATETIIIGTDPRGLITIFSRGAEDMLGYSAEEMVGRQTPMILHLASELEERGKELGRALGRTVSGFEIFTCRAESDGGEQHDWTLVRKDGSHLPVSLIVTALRSGSGDIIGYLGIARDVTEARAYESSLMEAKRLAEQANIAKSQFVANMSHEIRTPMNAILGMVQLLQHTELTPVQQDYADKTQAAAQSLLGILNDILDFSKVEAGKVELEQRPFEIEQVLRDLAVILGANAGPKNIEILFSVDPNLPRTVIGDALRLQQVLINLGGNAVKFTQHGEVVISLHAKRFSETHVEIEFSTRDTGIGISPQQLGHIFEGFSQAEASTTRRFGGTGLGLAISRRLIELMGGELQVESQPGVGSTFYFTLGFGRVAKVEPSQQAKNSPLRTLIVEDNETARDILKEMAAALDWQATTLASGDALLEQLHKEDALPYDVIFMDWHMEGTDGWETSRRIRQWQHEREAAKQQKGRPPIIVMITAHDRELMTARMNREKSVLNGFLIKPITPAMLAGSVSEAMIGHRVPHPLPTAVPQRLRGLRLLVVEDNRMNQKVAIELLTGEGAQVELASGGQEGIQKALATQPPFDAVLMDLQMPDIDGYTATREIRRHFGIDVLPILAMTANVMASDQQACLEAGMNAHIPKPIDLNTMVGTILKFCRPADTASNDVPPPPPATEGTAVLAPDKALARIDGNKGLFARMASAFISDARALYGQIRSSVLSQDGKGKDQIQPIHTLKGIAASVGAERLAASAAAAEKRLTAGTVDTAERHALVTELEKLVQQSCAALLPYAESEGARSPSRPVSNDDVPMEALLSRLEEQLTTHNMRACATLERLQQCQAPELASHLPALAEAINRLDFKLALRHCQTLRQGLP